MDTDVKVSQQDEDKRTQDALTGKVGVRLERAESSSNSPWTMLKRLLRMDR
jgi:hypothetical protein